MPPTRATFNRLLAVVVLLCGGHGTAAALHRCPHHHGPGGGTPTGSVHAQAAAGAHGSSHDVPCTCVGACCGSAVAPLAASLLAATVRVPALTARAPASWPGTPGPRSGPTPYFHAFPNPPPTG